MGDQYRRVVYVAHPVAGDVPGNVARAKRWLHWLVKSDPTIAFIAPWIAHLEADHDDADPVQRERGLLDAIATVRRCDGIVLVGGRISPGMLLELEAAVEAGRTIIDWTYLGDDPPLPPLAASRAFRYRPRPVIRCGGGRG